MEIHQSILFKPVINCFGSPNSGKSTLAPYLFSTCKSRGANCEIILEAAKDYIYEKNKVKIWNQPYVFGEQLQRMIRAIEDVDFIITDSPLLLSIIYTPDCFSELKSLAKQTYSYFDNYAYMLPVFPKYQNTGRRHSKAESTKLSKAILELVYEENNDSRVLVFKDHDLEKNTQAIIQHANLERFF